ncbi:hypothetical protein CsatB_029201 [Cannabis sativa]
MASRRIPFRSRFARAQSSAEDEAASETVDESSDLGIVGEDVQDFGDEIFNPAPGIDTVSIFPKNSARVVTAGEETDLLVGVKRPTYCFLLWLAVQDRLKTRQRLVRFQIATDAKCILCNESDETTEHLYFCCKYSKECLEQVKAWLGWGATTKSLQEIIRWLNRAKKSKFRKAVYAAATAALVYHIWRTKNCILWQGNNTQMQQMIQEVKWQVKTRITCVMPKKVAQIVYEWFDPL